MSSKINVIEIISGHIKTLNDPKGKIYTADLFVFYLLPLLLAILSIYHNFNLDKDITSLLVNFGAIFTALLLSVLVLVYDQESKIELVKKTDSLYEVKKNLLRELYYNISYSILCSVFLVLLCFFHSVVNGYWIEISVFETQITMKFDVFVATPLVVFITSNLFLNIIMIVKRMHTLLTTQHGK